MSTKKNLLTAASATMLIVGSVPATATAAMAVASPTDEASACAPIQEAVGNVVSTLVKADAAEGSFAWDQETITPNEYIKTVFARFAATVCGSSVDQASGLDAMEWTLSVNGDVAHAFSATVQDLADESSVNQTMSCTCGGNPSDGRANITAKVTGLPVSYLASRASAQSGVNAITFVSMDGTEVTLPFAYVIGHHGVISYEVNGEDLSESVGGFNQLWLEGASANYFVRDVVEIRITIEEETPALPGADMDYPNSPNVGVVSSQVG